MPSKQLFLEHSSASLMFFFCFNHPTSVCHYHNRRQWRAGVPQSVYCVTTDWTTGIRSPAEAKDFSSNLCVQTSSEAHRASDPMGTGGPFPGVKRGRGVTLTTQLHVVYRLGTELYLPSCRLHDGSGTALLFVVVIIIIIIIRLPMSLLRFCQQF
jgi:hypothetical protein